ncbi:ABC transporter ATP-binding protein [Paenibacillus luteus]|uniref:ABC transporter ATP-binding protein n=1 Tax=Paenibacillus luteus TaxID=2545753 RepID=UPI001144DBC4|nr:ABC transporter ATP-binding protein [Paenibacillus luteus]
MVAVNRSLVYRNDLKLTYSLQQSAAKVVLSVRQLQIETTINRQDVLVHEVSLELREGEMLALIGESGSGKSLTASAIAGLLPNTLKVSGEIVFNDYDLMKLKERQWKQLRGKHIGWVFQDYQSSFTPYLTIGSQLIEIVRTHEPLSRREAKQVVLSWLNRVDVPAEHAYSSYPFQLSGGQRQRIALAAALMLKPSLLIADEPTTALDVLNSKKIMDLIIELQAETGCAVLFITHDLRQVWGRANELAVMRRGRVVESGITSRVRERPDDPYTRELFAACPRLIPPGELEEVMSFATERCLFSE